MSRFLYIFLYSKDIKISKRPSGFPGGTVVKNPPANAGDERDVGFIPGLGRSPGGGNGHPLQYSCLGNSMDRGASRAMGLQRVRHDLATKQQQIQKRW